ncbi:hypothetical protein [Maribacter sp. ACAM166]|uniref:hypothetical protein n=1 Tax=Maribacter sp. ACAM166 TaxID=2508996 RepID=UPI0010FE45BB|nr:hypothetical protein [Maribacter sp. ACAM166]TLP81268.1 hypothetical protein ES765_04460 [Maribacter sp. ACAM166]
MIPKTYPDFTNSLQLTNVPEDWPDALKAMWFDAKGDWDASHDIAQEMQSKLGSWMHAYLHRKEGDRFNAGYWYRLADKTYPKTTLDEELEEIVVFIIKSM